MLKWVVTKRAASTAPRVPPINGPFPPVVTQPEFTCSCDKENHCEETIEFETNNNTSYAFNDLGNFYSPRKCRLSSGPLNRTADSRGGTPNCSCRPDPSPSQNRPRNGQTPLSSRNQLRKKLRTRRERNKTLAMRLSVASLNASLSEHATVVGHTTPAKAQNAPLGDLFNLYREPPSAKAELLQTFLNSNPGPFQEREVKTPEGPSPLADGAGQLIRQRAVRRKQPPPPPHQLQQCKLVKTGIRGQKMETNDSPSAFYSAYIFRELAREMLV